MTYEDTGIKVPRSDPSYGTQYKRLYRKRNPAYRKRENEKNKERHAKRRLTVLEHYGMKCVCCGETHQEFLTIDHINGDGGKQRNQIKQQANNVFAWIIKHKFPKDLQVICRNCHTAKHWYGGCPHKREQK